MEEVVNDKINKSFWYGKRVFITGHTGFKGSWLCLWLQELGAIVTGYSLKPPTQPNLFELSNCGNNMNSLIGDVRDYDRLSKEIANANPEIVFHLAAQPLVLNSYNDPIETYSTNVMGVVNLFEAARKVGKNIKVIINVTTDKCYENKEWHWSYRENEPMGGFDPYSSSKGCSELITNAFRNSYFNPNNYSNHGLCISTARAGNVIGGGDWAENRLIPDIMNSLISNKTIIIRYPNAIRPWQHVLEPLSGYLCLANKMYNDGQRFSEAWNFGPYENDVKSVDWIVNRITNLWGANAGYKIQETDKLHEATYLKLDISKAINRLNWKPTWNIEQSLELIVEWYKIFNNNENIRNISLKQIQLFEKFQKP
jgi:CDP-glucose 4,6-dehydratase